jgi:hypothetical protein
MKDEITSAVRWYWAWIKVTARTLWDSLPGPWPVKIMLLIATQLIVGPFDEIALIGGPVIYRRARRWYRARRARLARS